MHVRVCPECGEEFRPEIVRCSDCGAMLEDRHENEPGADPVSAPRDPVGSEATEGHYVSIFHADRAADLEPLAVRLGEAGLPFRVRSAQQRFDLLTREEDEAKVREALGEILAHRAPTGVADEPHFDPEGGYAACPACGCRLAPRAEECPECGLAVGAVAEAAPCPRCGSTPDPFGRCATCGPLNEQQ